MTESMTLECISRGCLKIKRKISRIIFESYIVKIGISYLESYHELIHIILDCGLMSGGKKRSYVLKQTCS